MKEAKEQRRTTKFWTRERRTWEVRVCDFTIFEEQEQLWKFIWKSKNKNNYFPFFSCLFFPWPIFPRFVVIKAHFNDFFFQDLILIFINFFIVLTSFSQIFKNLGMELKNKNQQEQNENKVFKTWMKTKSRTKLLFYERTRTRNKISPALLSFVRTTIMNYFHIPTAVEVFASRF